MYSIFFTKVFIDLGALIVINLTLKRTLMNKQSCQIMIFNQRNPIY